MSYPLKTQNSKLKTKLDAGAAHLVTEDLWQRSRTLFDAAVDLPPAARLAYLDATCAGEPALREEVLGLLAADEGADAPQFDAVARIAASVGYETDLEVNQTIGPYQIDRELAHGGMGTVFLAHRADDEFQRQVAIKVIRGYPDEDLVRRFRIERQILANLDHTHIARLIDGGATGSGLPYLVMEYVAGQPIGEVLRRPSSNRH